MDLRFFFGTAVARAAHSIRILAGAALLCACVTGTAQARDYLYPSEIQAAGADKSVSQLQSNDASSGLQSNTRYHTFDGQSFDLREHRGLYVRVLTPESVADSPNLTPDHLEELVDRLDELYSLYREILNREPGGTGLLTVAFVPETCGNGCGLLGAKGIEIEASALTYEPIIRELDAGRLDEILVHEMAHNFDIFANYLHYLPDHPHAWTDFFQYFAAYRYGRNSLHNEAADEVYQSPVNTAWRDYVTDPSADWALCVRDGDCADQGLSANNVWAMPYYRMEATFGTEAIVQSFEFLVDYMKHNSIPGDLQAKEDLRTLSLAAGANRNIGCLMEALKWPVSSSLERDMQKRFGGGSTADCSDGDGDGFIAVTGDCDDSDPLRNLLASETTGNGRDDDCDGLVDEETLVEASLGDGEDNFGQVAAVSLPFEASGEAFDSDDNDLFSFHTLASRRTHVTICSVSDFKGWAAALDSTYQFAKNGSYYVYQAGPGCSSSTFDYGDLPDGLVAVMPDQSAGNYTLMVKSAEELPADHSVYLTATPRSSGGVTLRVNDPEGQLQKLGADTVELWVSGTEVRRLVPWSPEIAFTLDRNSAAELADGDLYQVRLRALANGRPVLPFSAGHLFRYSAQASAPPGVDGRYSGAWFDTEHEGEGFIVEALAGNLAVVYWFTYQPDGSQRWMNGVGDVSGSRIVVNHLFETRGGRFGAEFDPSEVVLEDVGSLTISFSSCNDAVVNYSIDNNGGNQTLQRLSTLQGHGCGDSGLPPASDLSGSWYDPSHNGEGFVVQQLDAQLAVVFWFSYDAEGNQAWMFNAGSIEGGLIRFPDLLQPSGAHFGRSFDPADVSMDPWGTLELDLDCNGGPASYTSQAKGFSSGSQQLVNLTRVEGSGCD